MLPMAGLTLGQFCGGLVARRYGASTVIAVLTAVLTILPAGIFLGFLTILLTSYPHFLINR
jgi:hypothetical protein